MVCPDEAACKQHIESIAPVDVQIYRDAAAAFEARLQVTSYKLRITGYKLQAASYKLQATSYAAHQSLECAMPSKKVPRRAAGSSGEVRKLTTHTPPATCNLQLVTCSV